MKNNELHYTLNNLLSYNAPISIATSIRNLGKSYSAMLLEQNNIKKGKNVVWSRWDREQTKLAMHEYINFSQDIEYRISSISEGIKILTPKDNDDYGQIFFVPVKEASKAKGIDREFSYWTYDEFLPEFYASRVQKEEEFAKWNSLFTTLKRDTPDFRAILLSNCISWFNSYFTAWNIKPFPSGQIRRFPQIAYGIRTDVVMENVKPSHLALERVIRDETAKGKSEEEIKRYVENATQDKDFFIGTCPDLNVPLHWVQFFHHGDYYGYREYDDHIYFCKIQPRNDRPVMALNRRELQDGMMRDRGAGKHFEDWINSGIARFDSVKTFNAILDLIALSREHL